MPTEPADPTLTGDERTTLTGYLEEQRSVLAWKCQELGPEELRRRAVPPSRLSLLGLVRHMAEVERYWFRCGIAGEGVGRIWGPPQSAFEPLDGVEPAACFAAWEEECAASRRILERLDSLDRIFTTSRDPQISARCIVNHMIEEYSRHNGHADLLRERIDGSTGDFPGTGG